MTDFDICCIYSIQEGQRVVLANSALQALVVVVLLVVLMLLARIQQQLADQLLKRLCPPQEESPDKNYQQGRFRWIN